MILNECHFTVFSSIKSVQESEGYAQNTHFRRWTQYNGKVSTMGTVFFRCMFWDISESFELLHYCNYYIYMITFFFFPLVINNEFWVVKILKWNIRFLIWTSPSFWGNCGDRSHLWKRFSCVTAVLGRKIKINLF